MTAHWMRLAETGMVTDGDMPACYMLGWVVMACSIHMTHTQLYPLSNIQASCSLDPYHRA